MSRMSCGETLGFVLVSIVKQITLMEVCKMDWNCSFICNIVHLQEVQVHNVSSIQSCLKYQKVFKKKKFPLLAGSSQVQIADDSITITTIGQGFLHYQSKQPLDPKNPMKMRNIRVLGPKIWA